MIFAKRLRVYHLRAKSISRMLFTKCLCRTKNLYVKLLLITLIGGTLREYNHYCKKHLTIFCDVDGVLLKNGSKFAKTGWQTPGIEANLKKLLSCKKMGEYS